MNARFPSAFSYSVLAALLLVGSQSENANADLLFRFGQAALFDGKFGPIAEMQTAAAKALADCGKTKLPTADGKFGPGTRNALSELTGCPAMAAKLNGDSDAAAGAITTAYWGALLPGKTVPAVDDRAHTIMLTYEATDYTSLEWNFCQSSPLYNPAKGHNVCFSNDPKSYLTWGPNGATAGGGREVQLILSALDGIDHSFVDDSFGTEANAVCRMFKLKDRDPERSLETYLCGVWAVPSRRTAWKAGFAKIGSRPKTREMFDKLYRSSSLDGGKIASFYQAYRKNHLTPTEVDYGFFKDRAAHTSVSAETVRKVIADQLSHSPGSKPWQIRQAIALNIRPVNQKKDRLGRDVAFYIDEAASNLSAEEMSAWQSRGRLRASDVGLSDDRLMADFQAEPAIDTGIDHPDALTPVEKKACPQAVLDTQKP